MGVFIPFINKTKLKLMCLYTPIRQYRANVLWLIFLLLIDVKDVYGRGERYNLWREEVQWYILSREGNMWRYVIPLDTAMGIGVTFGAERGRAACIILLGLHSGLNGVILPVLFYSRPCRPADSSYIVCWVIMSDV